MLFNSIEFAIYLPVMFLLYWFVTSKNLKLQNALLMVASYIFYGWWDWRFLSLIVFSSFVDFFVGIKMSNIKAQARRKAYLIVSVAVNIGFLGFFKYFNFFAESFADAFTLFGEKIDPLRLNIVLPVGISFYTFQTLSYSIDVYKRRMEPTKDIISFFAFVSFFPQLVAGPIERATNLLPQFYKKRNFDYTQAVDGLRQILWGLFKKVVIADNCANFVNEIFSNYASYSGSTLVIGAFFFAFQIYGDFSGYSDIAIGTSRLFGFNLMRNFAYPYFSRDIAEFWRRWHISLSTWFRDYVYFPLGGSRGGAWMKVRNTFVIFLVSGFWHGANWTFIVWGFLNACYFIPLLLMKRNRINTDTISEGRLLPSLKEFLQVCFTFALTLIAWVFFRSENLSMAFDYLGHVFSPSLFAFPDFEGERRLMLMIFIALLVVVEWVQREKQHALQIDNVSSSFLRWSISYVLIVVIFKYGGNQETFIYFQF